MDQSWMFKDRRLREHEEGVENFINFALEHCLNQSVIRCPCMRYGNLNIIHLTRFGNSSIDQSYRTWYWHGEVGPINRQPNEMKQFYDTINCGDATSTIKMVHAIKDEFMTNLM